MDISYSFEFGNGRLERFNLELDDETFLLPVGAISGSKASWMELGCHQCPGCTLPDSALYCPIAVNLGGIVEPFENELAIARVTTRVLLRGRKISKECDLQEGLSSLIGLVMATSGCPILDKLRPMAYLHQPFAEGEETLFRAATTFLMGQHIRQQCGEEASLDLKGLSELFKQINQLNSAFTERLDDHFQHDNTNTNAVILLDSFTEVIPFDFEFIWEKQAMPLFSAYLDAPQPQ